MSLTRFTVRGSSNAELSIANTAFPSTITIADLEPVDGAFPTFTTAPIVYVIGASSDRVWIDESQTTTTTFVAKLRSGGGAPGTYTFNVAIETEDTPAAAVVGVVTRQVPYYCSKEDVEDSLINLKISFGTNGSGDFSSVNNNISRAYGAISSALSIGGYTVPATLDTSILITSALTAAETPVTLSLDSSSSLTVTDFPIASTIRVSGKQSGSVNFLDEFVPIIAHGTTKQLTVNFLKNSYPSGSTTMSLCTEGFLFLRHCNALGAVAYILRGFNIKRDASDENSDNFMEEFKDCLEQLRSGDMVLDGLTKDSSSFIRSYQSINPNAADNLNQPFFAMDRKY